MVEYFDVAVVGGGPAGIAAAISAAGRGARTLLVERSDILGGNAGNALVHTICGLYLPAGDGSAEYAHSGFPKRFAELLLRCGAARAPEKAGRVHVLPTFPHRLVAAAGELCGSTAGLEVSLDATVVDAVAGDDGFEIGISRADLPATVRAAVAIDTSGDAALASQLSAEVYEEAPESLQNPSFIFRIRGVDPAETDGFARMRVSHAVARAAMQSELPAGAGSVLLRPGPVEGEAYVTLNVRKPADRDYQPLERGALVSMTDQARSDAEALIAHLRSSRAGFAECEVIEWPRRMGVRETRRVAGRETVEAADILAGRREDDEVALSTWPIELWHDPGGARFSYPQAPSSVPLGALVSRTNARLGMAGRCLSASHEALGALRVIGTAMATGEAIGIAAAIASDRGVALTDVGPREVRAARKG